jgi:hypothetical protein
MFHIVPSPVRKPLLSALNYLPSHFSTAFIPNIHSPFQRQMLWVHSFWDFASSTLFCGSALFCLRVLSCFPGAGLVGFFFISILNIADLSSPPLPHIPLLRHFPNLLIFCGFCSQPSIFFDASLSDCNNKLGHWFTPIDPPNAVGKEHCWALLKWSGGVVIFVFVGSWYDRVPEFPSEDTVRTQEII